MSIKQHAHLLLAFGILLSISCQPGLWPNLQSSQPLVSDDPAMAPEVYFKKTKISPAYQGPLSIAIDPAIQPDKTFGVRNVQGSFRITAKSENNPPGESQRRMAWSIEHPTGGHHGREDLGRYFDPNNPTAFPGLQIDPAMGDEDVGGGDTAGFVSINGSKPVKFTSKILTVFPKSEAALQEILALVGGRVIGRQIEEYVNIELDLDEADLGRLPEYLRLRSQYLHNPITSANFSSLNMARTVTQLLMLFTREDLLYSATLEGYSVTDSPSYETDDPRRPNGSFGDHLHLHRVGEAWEYGLGTKVRVAYIDQNGFIDQTRHLELRRATSEMDDAIFDGTKRQFEYPVRIRLPWQGPGLPVGAYHGTTSSLVGFADINNLVNGLGVAPNVTLVPIKVSESTIDKSNAIRYAVRTANVDVIGASFHTEKITEEESRLTGKPVTECFGSILNEGDDLRRAIAWANSLGVPYVASAGNQNEDTWNNIEGGCTAEALLVGGVEQSPSGIQRWDDGPYGASNYSDRVDIWASARVKMDDLEDLGPTSIGRDIWSEGTSVSAPIVAGTVAIMKGIQKKLGRPFLSVPLIKQILWDTGTKHNINVKGKPYTISVLNAEAAVRETYRRYFYTPTNPDDFKRQEYFGIMVNARPDSRGKSEIADLILNGIYRPNVLQATVAAGAYSRYIALSPVAGYAYVKVHAWPDGEAFEVFKVDLLPWPSPVLTSIAPSRLHLGADETVTVSGQFLANPQLRLYDQTNRLVGTTNQPRSTNATLTNATFSIPSGLNPGTYMARAVTVSGESNSMSIVLESGDTPTVTVLKQFRDNRELHFWGGGFTDGMVLRLTAAQLPAPVELPLRLLQRNTSNGDYAVFEADFLPAGNYSIKLVSAYGNTGQGYGITVGVPPTQAPPFVAATMTAYATIPSQSAAISSFVVQGQNFTPDMTMKVQPQDNSFTVSAPIMTGSLQKAVSAGQDRASVTIPHSVLTEQNYAVAMHNSAGLGNIVPASMGTATGGVSVFRILGLPNIFTPPAPTLCPTGYVEYFGSCKLIGPSPSPDPSPTSSPSPSPSATPSPSPSPSTNPCPGWMSNAACGWLEDGSNSNASDLGVTMPGCACCNTGYLVVGKKCIWVP